MNELSEISQNYLKVKEKCGVTKLSGASEWVAQLGLDMLEESMPSRIIKKNTYSLTDYIGSRVCASYSPPLDKSFVIIQKCVELQDGLLFVSNIIIHVIQIWSIILHILGFLDSENFVICICCLFLWRHIGKWKNWKCVKVLSMCFLPLCSCACGMKKCILIPWQHCFHLCAHALGLASFCFFRDTITQDVTDTTTKSCRVPWSTR